MTNSQRENARGWQVGLALAALSCLFIAHVAHADEEPAVPSK